MTEEQFNSIEADDDIDYRKEPYKNYPTLIKLHLKPDEKVLEQKKFSFEFTNIPAGIYLIHGFQDVNGNGLIDHGGLFGSPSEP